MTISFIKLPGLEQEKILALVEPILAEHSVDGVELWWRGDPEGHVLELSLEIPGTKKSGEGITIDLCTEISRKVSEALDEADIIEPKYRLEVGSPGVERALYVANDFKRFAGQDVKLKLIEPSEQEGLIGQKTIRGNLFGLDDENRILVETDHGMVSVSRDNISSARLAFSWGQAKRSVGRAKRPANGGSSARKTKQRSNQNGRR